MKVHRRPDVAELRSKFFWRGIFLRAAEDGLWHLRCALWKANSLLILHRMKLEEDCSRYSFKGIATKSVLSWITSRRSISSTENHFRFAIREMQFEFLNLLNDHCTFPRETPGWLWVQSDSSNDDVLGLWKSIAMSWSWPLSWSCQLKKETNSC